MRASLKYFEQYLSRYAEPESRSVLLPDTFDSVVAIPSLGEDLTRVIDSIEMAASASGKKVLIIIVVNNRADHSPHLIASNQELLSRVKPVSLPLSDTIFFRPPNHLFIDRSTLPLPEKQGVGLARKMGCDVALRLIAEKKVLSKWIHCTDGDCEVPLSYFDIAHPESTAACLYPFEHVLDWSRPTEAQALKLYDYSLRYYVDGLARVGSPYAYHSLGSTLALHSDYYAMARGFPKIAAAEDFYLLNKLAKLGKIESLTKPIIKIHQRISDRVPFGTGVSTRKISEDITLSRPFLLYNPLIFDAVGTFISQCKAVSYRPHDKDTIFGNFDDGHLPPGALEAINIALKTRTSQSQVFKHLMDWFDAFRTLKYVHQLRDERFGMVGQ